jgi:hypothetical protein
MRCAQVRCVGHFADAMEAARAYDRAVLECRGDKAVTNFSLEELQQQEAAQPAARTESTQAQTAAEEDAAPALDQHHMPSFSGDTPDSGILQAQTEGEGLHSGATPQQTWQLSNGALGLPVLLRGLLLLRDVTRPDR